MDKPLEEMILDLEGRGWRLEACYWSNHIDKYVVELKEYDTDMISTGRKFYTETLTFKGAITEAWRHCK